MNIKHCDKNIPEIVKTYAVFQATHRPNHHEDNENISKMIRRLYVSDLVASQAKWKPNQVKPGLAFPLIIFKRSTKYLHSQVTCISGFGSYDLWSAQSFQVAFTGVEMVGSEPAMQRFHWFRTTGCGWGWGTTCRKWVSCEVMNNDLIG